MIQKTELRFGNYVKTVVPDEKHIQVMGITNHGIHLQNQTVLGFELLKPAAITQEILQKSGFIYGRKYNQTGYYDLIPAWKDHREQIWDFKLNKHHIKYIRFLHEAQNLFFDLSSAELEVNI